MEKESVIKSLFSFLIIIAVTIGAYFLLTGSSFNFFDNSKKNDNKEKFNNSPSINNKEIKIDKSKDLIYYETVEIVSLNLDIIHKYPIININNEKAKAIQDKIKIKVEKLKNTTIYAELAEEIALCEDKIKEVNEIRYEIFEYKNYYTLVVYEGLYSCLNEGAENIVSSYTFDTTTGELIEQKDIFNKYNTSFSNIKNEITTVLQNKLDEIALNDESLIDFIDITTTINNLKTNETFIAYINNKGKLEINFVVITKQVNYNETIVL